MTVQRWFTFAILSGLFASPTIAQTTSAPAPTTSESRQQFETRMAWWRDARFGMFIHWGLYAIPAGKWRDETQHGEWIRDSAKIPLAEYDTLTQQFNPTAFDATKWIDVAEQAGVQYVVITSKHHDGFCLFDSAETDFDVMSTPFKRDILKELADAARRRGVRMCWYHSIMDWHHPDYLPRRPWEQAARPVGDADRDRYVAHMKKQLRELLSNYGQVGVLWFDGEWENTWTHERGKDLYHYVRGLQPSIIINNRVDVGRAGMAGFRSASHFMGDFDTPEQEIPAGTRTDVDWETCMTMNDHWGYNAADNNWKSPADLIRKLCTVAGRGGNFLLNVGPTAAGEFPPQALERFKAIGDWMKLYGASIYGTSAGPFVETPWGACTFKRTDEGLTRLYVHVFDWPRDPRVVLPGLVGAVKQAYVLTPSGEQPIESKRVGDAVHVALPAAPIDRSATVVAVDILGPFEVSPPPTISADHDQFLDELAVSVSSRSPNVEIRYEFDSPFVLKTSPIATGPIKVDRTLTVSARAFRDGRPISPMSQRKFEKVLPKAAVNPPRIAPGLTVEYFEGEWDKLPEMGRLGVVKRGVANRISLEPAARDENFGLRFMGFVKVSSTGLYRFHLESDDGSKLAVAGVHLIDNDGPHVLQERSAVIALEAGLHPFVLTYFQGAGERGLRVSYEGPGLPKGAIADDLWFHVPIESGIGMRTDLLRDSAKPAKHTPGAEPHADLRISTEDSRRRRFGYHTEFVARDRRGPKRGGDHRRRSGHRAARCDEFSRRGL
ncbi:MAG: alpha-L-fucosidase [Phycisphaerae bacterium]